MDAWKQRATVYLTFVSVALLATAAGYQWGMRVYEEEPKTFLNSLQFAVEMFTTTGFGGDAPWTSPQMQLFITVTDLLGMAILVGALPVFVGPTVENALSTSTPARLDSAVSDHVVICSDTTRAEELIAELDANDVSYVIVEPDDERAEDLRNDGYRVIRADPKSTDGLKAARLSSARALFADESDQVDASIVLAAKEVAEDVPVVSVVEDPEKETYHRLAGADQVLSPRSLLGQSLVAKVTTAANMKIDEAVAVGDRLELAEVSIRHGSRLAGSTLADSGVREQTGVNVIGVWIRGDFTPAPSPDTQLIAGSVLLVTGRREQLDRLVEITQSSVRQFGTRDPVVIGYGQVGQAVSAELDDAGIPHTTVDKVDADGVDVVGDATEPETLSEAGVQNAETVILALSDDNTTEFVTLVVRDVAPDTQIIARVQEKSNVSKTYRAGSDYVLSLTTITGRMSAARLLEGREVVSLEQQVEIVREQLPSLAGQTVGEMNIREQTGCTIIAVKNEEEVITDIGPDTTIQADDELLVVGTDDGIRAFEQAFGQSRSS